MKTRKSGSEVPTGLSHVTEKFDFYIFLHVLYSMTAYSNEVETDDRQTHTHIPHTAHRSHAELRNRKSASIDLQHSIWSPTVVAARKRED